MGAHRAWRALRRRRRCGRARRRATAFSRGAIRRSTCGAGTSTCWPTCEAPAIRAGPTRFSARRSPRTAPRPSSGSRGSPGATARWGCSGYPISRASSSSSPPSSPPHLKCIFAPWAGTDQYRDAYYHGGILNKNWALHWGRGSLHNGRYDEREPAASGATRRFDAALARALQDPDLRPRRSLPGAPQPRQGRTPAPRRHRRQPARRPLLGRRRFDYEDHRGARLHRRRLVAVRPAPARRLPELGPPARAEEDDRRAASVSGPSRSTSSSTSRCAGSTTGSRASTRGSWTSRRSGLFLMGTHQWRQAEEWPLPETRWTPFYLHENGLLWEREHYPNEGSRRSPTRPGAAATSSSPRRRWSRRPR